MDGEHFSVSQIFWIKIFEKQWLFTTTTWIKWRNDSTRWTKTYLFLKFEYLQSCLYLRMSLDTARQIAWNPFPVSPSSDVSVKYNEFPDERMRDGIVEPQNVPSSGDLDWDEKKVSIINSLSWLRYTKLSLKLFNRAFPN